MQPNKKRILLEQKLFYIRSAVESSKSRKELIAKLVGRCHSVFIGLGDAKLKLKSSCPHV